MSLVLHADGNAPIMLGGPDAASHNGAYVTSRAIIGKTHRAIYALGAPWATDGLYEASPSPAQGFQGWSGGGWWSKTGALGLPPALLVGGALCFLPQLRGRPEGIPTRD